MIVKVCSEAKYRLRIAANNGITRNGVETSRPNDFETFFQLATSSGLKLTEANVVCSTPEGFNMAVLGLAELGNSPIYDSCYTEDMDNIINICLTGDKEAVEIITHVYTPSSEGYASFYNPGGPGIIALPGVTHTAPSDLMLTPVINALDDPMTVSYCAAEWELSLKCSYSVGSAKVYCCPGLLPFNRTVLRSKESGLNFEKINRGKC